MRLFFSVGEPSGDVHGANLIRHLKRLNPRVQCVGYGGPRMAAAGADLHYDLTRLSVMWLFRVLAHLGAFWSLCVRADRYFHRRRPDAVILIDYPGFNWWVAWRAKAHGIPVFYYGTPQIWAWATWRVRKMRKYVDHVICKLPFEVDWYRKRGVDAIFVGHPFYDEVVSHALDEAFVLEQTSQPGPLVTILPGSRTQEVTSNLKWFLKAAGTVRGQVPQVRFAIAAFNEKQADIARGHLSASGYAASDVEVHVGHTPELMAAATCCMACSGSVSLELLYHTRPTVILYHVSRSAYQFQKLLRRVRFITLVNLLNAADPLKYDLRPYDPGEPDADRVLFPEYLTCEDKSAKIAGHLIEWLTNPERLQARIEGLARLKDRVAHPGASQRAAEYILGHVPEKAIRFPRPHMMTNAEQARLESDSARAG